MGTNLSQQMTKRSGSIGLAPTGDFSRPGTGMWRVFQRSRHLGCAHSLTFALLLRSTEAAADAELMWTEILSPNLSFLQRASERFGDMTVPKCHGTCPCIAKTKPRNATWDHQALRSMWPPPWHRKRPKLSCDINAVRQSPRDGVCGMRRVFCGHGGTVIDTKNPRTSTCI